MKAIEEYKIMQKRTSEKLNRKFSTGMLKYKRSKSRRDKDDIFPANSLEGVSLKKSYTAIGL